MSKLTLEKKILNITRYVTTWPKLDLIFVFSCLQHEDQLNEEGLDAIVCV